MSYAVPEMKQVTVQQVVLILGLAAIMMAGVIILALNGQDVGAIFGALATLGFAVATALGFNLKHTMDQVKDISNGRLTQMLDENKALNERVATLAMMMQPPPERDP